MFAAIIIGIFIVSVIYAHSRGADKLKISRQIFDHSTFLAPINMFMTAFSRLPKTPFVPHDDYPEVIALIENWQVIRDEGLRLQDHIKAAKNNDDAGFNTFFKRGWKRFYLKWYSDEPHPSACELCPVTTRLVSQMPHVKMAMFTRLPAQSHLGRHRDPYAGSVRLHLGLATPNDDRCFIEVDKQRYSWRDGQAVIFDETYVHWVDNQTDESRLILMCDLERPMKWRWAQQVNRWVGQTLLAAASSPNDENDHVGAISRLFKYVNAIRNWGQAHKKRNRKRYYIVKNLLIVTIFALIIIPSVFL